ncbi:MAG: trypsin-like peptidase domain-containing protein [Acidobacteriales bacterium]|nr:trypsin-like peptidase domain-containing protein [Terriglobales bacterium]
MSDEFFQQEEVLRPRWIQAALGVLLLLITGAVIYYYAPHPDANLKSQVSQLTRQVDELRQEQDMPAMVLNHYRNSICYILGIYRVSFPGEKPSLRARISGTGFVVADGLLATNRHVAEPWYEDPESSLLIKKGAAPELEKLIAFFPGLSAPVNITPAILSAQGDLAVLRIEDLIAVHRLRPLPLAEKSSAPGELVAVVGYPMGILGMLAKSPPAVYERLAFRHDDQGAANELAALSLIRPSATCGHLGDVVADKLIYDAPTAHGGSGGPVFNSRGEVIGINAAYIDGFSGGTLGISVQALKPLILAAENKPQKRASKIN